MEYEQKGDSGGSKKLRVLIAHHEEHRTQQVESALKDLDLQIISTCDGNEAVRLLYDVSPNCVIIDRDLPETGGVWLCRWLKTDPATCEIPVILVEEGQTERCVDDAISTGADYTLRMPIDPCELNTIMSSLSSTLSLRRKRRILSAGDLKMTPDSWVVTLAGDIVHLTEKEYRLLRELLLAEGAVVSRETLLHRVWGYEESHEIHTRTLDVHMSRLRLKLGHYSHAIVTVRNIGYRIDIII